MAKIWNGVLREVKEITHAMHVYSYIFKTISNL